MASNPPNLEDQMDEDFFDKLVDDDAGTVMSSHNDEGNDSDDVKVVSNLGIGSDVANASTFGDSSVGGSSVGVKENEEEAGVKLDDGNVQEANFSVSSSSFGCSGMTDHGEHGRHSENLSGSSADKSTGIPSSEVKEVDWNSFLTETNGGVGFGSYSDFFNEFGDQHGKAYDQGTNNEVKPSNEILGDQYGGAYHDSNTAVKPCSEIPSDGLNTSVDYAYYQEGQGYDASVGNNTSVEDLNSSHYWESLYPGWKYDYNIGKWYQVDDHNATVATQGSSQVNTPSKSVVAGTLAESSVTEAVPNWNQALQENRYPEHMVFDPQYPGWYYDTISQEWRLLETYNSHAQSSSFEGHENGHVSTDTFSHNENNLYRDYGHGGYYELQGASSHAANNNWSCSYGLNHQQDLNTDTTKTVAQSGDIATYGGNQQFDHSFGSNIFVNKDQQKASSSFGSAPLYNKVNNNHNLANGTVELQRSAPSGNFAQQFNYSNTQFDEQTNFSNNYVESHQPFNYSNQSFHGGQQHSYAPHVGRSSDGRPPHALATFGFGGKLIIVKYSSLSSSTYGSQSVIQGSISVLNLMEVVSLSVDSPCIGNGVADYFRALGKQSIPGPLVGGSVGSKEVNKWIDERIVQCRSPEMDSKKSERMKLLLSLLKIACQYYGKLRSPFGSDTILKVS